ncbi:unnamed protein product [Adineta ricciae]|uniref:Apple domain-containing protein n=1 Tax=Adineta ricciae TaxID=249248 RepID=A0A815CE28_ADIRI|nr:unnamed protein product [Adineta ricciae]CAF1357578.1 unnamed protein product [Adineta ricciae]
MQTIVQDTRSFRMSVRNGWRYRCADTTCLPFRSVITPNIRKCETICLAQIQCEAASFHPLTLNCELFANVSDENGNVLVDMNTVTMIVIAGTRLPLEPTTSTTTTSTTSTTTTSTTSTTITSSTSTTSVTTTTTSKGK